MKPENTRTHKYLTDKDRDNVLRLIGCGLSDREIADIVNSSKTTVGYIRQAHKACVEQDWSTLQKLSTTIRPTVNWAMRVTGTDKVFEETFPKEEVPADSPKTDNTPAPETITKEDFKTLCSTLQDICYLLTEIRDILK